MVHLMAGCRMCRCTVMIFRFFTKSSYQLALLSLNGFFTFSFSFFSSSGLRTSILTVPTLRLAWGIGKMQILNILLLCSRTFGLLLIYCLLVCLYLIFLCSLGQQLCYTGGVVFPQLQWQVGRDVTKGRLL